MSFNGIRPTTAIAAGLVLTLLAALAGPAIPPAQAQSASLVNVVTVTAPAGRNDIDPSNDTGSATVSLGPAAAAYSFCAAPNGSAASNAIYSIVNGVQVWRYEAGAGADAMVPELALPSVAGNVNGLMIDPVHDRLLFHATAASMIWAYDAANGGWYAALPAGLGISDFPRAGMGPDGVGYMIASGASPAVYRVAADATGYGYTAVSIGNLQYDVAPTNLGSGDIAFDAAGFGWIAAGEDLYRIDFSLPGNPEAVRQAQPQLDGAAAQVQWAGVAFADDGRLFVANNASPSRYYAYDPATGALTEAAPTGANGSRDLASCAFPTLAQPELSVQKTLAEVNGNAYAAGATVAAGDVLTYAITVSNGGGAVGTLFPGDVVETMPANTTYVATGNDFACTGATCTTPASVNVPANGSAVLNFLVEVDSPVPTGVSAIANAVTFPNGTIDCALPGNDCVETTPLGPSVSVAKSANPADGVAVAAGQTLTYTLAVAVTGAATRSDVVLTDTLGPGLSFAAVTLPGDFVAGGSGSVRSFTLPAGADPGNYAVTYTATVDAAATVSVGNAVTATGGGDPGDPAAPPPACTQCQTQHPLTAGIVVSKRSDPVSGSQVAPGDVVTYILAVVVSNATTTEDLTLDDTLGAGLSFGQVTDPGSFVCAGTLSCTLPAGTPAGTYAMTYTATVDASASGRVGNVVTASNPPGGGDPDPVCTSCATEHEVVPASITVRKASVPASDSRVTPGDTIAYTLTVRVATSATAEALTLADTLGPGLSFGAVTDAGAFACTDALTCTLPAGTRPGVYALRYTATVDADATGRLGNVVTASHPPGGGSPPPVCTTCTTEHEVASASTTVAKSSDPASGTRVMPGDTIAYALTVTVGGSATTEPLSLADTLGPGLSFGAVTDAGIFACSGVLACTLPAGTLPGVYALRYTATVDADATGTVGNAVVARRPEGGNDPDPVCTVCTTEHPVAAPVIAVVKSSEPASGTEVRAGETLRYTLSVTVANSATLDTLTLADTLGAGLAFGAVTDAGAFACAGALTCTLPAGTLPGRYALSYTAIVQPDATDRVGNVVVASGGTGENGTPPSCDACSTEHPVADPRAVIVKSATPGDAAEIRIGDTIEYTLTVTVENSATRAELRLTDTPGPGLAVGTLPAGCSAGGGIVTCALPAGTLPGTYTFTYPARVTTAAVGRVENMVVGAYVGGGGNVGVEPECTTCRIQHVVVGETLLRIVKSVGARNVAIGDLVRYTVTVENLGTVDLADGIVVDTPPAGFSYVEGSMAVADRDHAFTLEGQRPLRIGGLDIRAGEQATLSYLLRVGAGVRQGVHVNEAMAVDQAGRSISNVATAQVALDADPLLDDSLVFGTVFDDRDGDGWQDRADLADVRVQGGFSPAAYVAGSTTIDRGDGPRPVADASAPLLHGIALGAIAGRQSVGDTAAAHRVVVRQRLRSLDFTGDFLLTSAQGVSVRMQADGRTSVERAGEAAKGLNAAAPAVERSVAAVEGGYEVAYTIANLGIDERGIPGVRIASVEGWLVETDQYGRYHLADVQGGESHHGRNFILKVDPATLPPGTEFTTANPRLRRLTPGLPVRFDFGVQLPVQEIPGGERRLELELGEVIFAPGSAEIREAYRAAIQPMAEQVRSHRGGEVVVVADGSSEALAFARASAVRDALLDHVGAEAAAGLSVVLRTEVEDPHSLVAGVDAGGALLGTVLFDTDQARIRPEFESLLDAVAARLEALRGGVVVIVGHTDVRGAYGYNAALGLRRAESVQRALAARLSPEARALVRVESSGDPKAPIGTERE